MGWSIADVVNTVVISDECAKELFEALRGDVWYKEDEVIQDGKLTFNSDQMEHMDYLDRDEVQEILKKHKVSGDICFASLEGDNAGSSWGYRFDGSGGMKSLVGKLVWEEVREPLKGKKIAITGRLSITRSEVEGMIRRAGGTVANSVSKTTDYLVLGADGGSKHAAAKKHKVAILTEDELRKLICE